MIVCLGDLTQVTAMVCAKFRSMLKSQFKCLFTLIVSHFSQNRPNSLLKQTIGQLKPDISLLLFLNLQDDTRCGPQTEARMFLETFRIFSATALAFSALIATGTYLLSMFYNNEHQKSDRNLRLVKPVKICSTM